MFPKLSKTWFDLNWTEEEYTEYLEDIKEKLTVDLRTYVEPQVEEIIKITTTGDTKKAQLLTNEAFKYLSDTSYIKKYLKKVDSILIFQMIFAPQKYRSAFVITASRFHTDLDRIFYVCFMNALQEQVNLYNERKEATIKAKASTEGGWVREIEE